MKNFNFQAPTSIFFGEGQINKLSRLLKEHGNNVLLTYGGGSIKKNGVYDAIYQELNNEFNVVELSGVEPNPRLDTVIKGAQLCRENNIDVILAVGGGSTIDCAKAVAAARFYDGNPWDFTANSGLVKEALPIVSILTIAATGSEMNGGSVITNLETKEKLSFGSRFVIPKASILDPTYTFSVPSYQTMAGSADILSHLFENYFNKTNDTMVQDGIAEGLMRTVYHYTPIVLKDPSNYEARANLMWASSLALNGLTGSGKDGSWSCHGMEHELSAYYDITHGIGLAIITPRWMAHVLSDETAGKFAEFGRRVFDLPKESSKIMAEKAIKLTYDSFKAWGIPMTLGEVGIDDSLLEEMAEQAVAHRPAGSVPFAPLAKEDVLTIFKASLEEMTF
ncbi:iron-containing alcohol dehydrogenase [Vagococcus sp. DIV0080]|uniref:Iron-containing alcohol dehydrogenase n=1 Tax=Candidatus Vagococcus giribetii TaxID=2230876 RepID=A0ABS3HQT1_9ENTE|nr:iron-containing alcohol dehydrogenase [Vagococcus sp. DIV0080]MBO0476101.1 iron-containing alcohol dehydrogenase [Vagococcus sp. DIV0080]